MRKEYKPFKAQTVYFTHIYDNVGFAVSAELIGNKKEYKPDRIHACLRHGYWCFDNFKENPRDIFSYLYIQLFKNWIQYIILTLVVIMCIMLYMSQRARLQAYNDWYMCEQYGRKEYCK